MTSLDLPLALACSALLLAEALTFGTLVVGLLQARPHRALIRAGFAALAVLGPAWLVLQSLDIGGTPAMIPVVLEVTRIGHAALLRLVLWAASFALLRRHPRTATLPAAAAMALHAASGHAAAAGDPVLLASVLAHVLAAGAWIGGLPALWRGLAAGTEPRLLHRFATLGLACVLTLAGTATVQALQLAGGPLGLIGTAYGHLLLLKLALFAGLIALALRHRFAGLPPDRLRRSILIETALGVATLLAASLLSGLPPGAHEQPTWPFSWRLSLDPLADDDIRAEVMNALLTLIAAGAIFTPATTRRRLLLPGLVLALALAWRAGPHLAVLRVDAEPSFYWSSPIDPSPAAYTAGALAYAAHCVSCHGTAGQGDGPLAASLAIPPADLTAPHLWDHPDGQLFWWLAHGMRGPDGGLVMPGYADRLEEETLWSLIVFLHDNNPNGTAQPAVHHHH